MVDSEADVSPSKTSHTASPFSPYLKLKSRYQHDYSPNKYAGSFQKAFLSRIQRADSSIIGSFRKKPHCHHYDT